MKLSFFQKLAIIRKAEKATKRIKELAKNNEQLSVDMHKALFNLNADIDVLIGLLPSCRNALSDVKRLINDILAD
ncbi:MAG: hypothetical protein II453_10185 [Alphaproteobacteria bacterium]|nr:hypothetical protein [Alphaproteobacteria bacterium]MBQ3946379.1 hypothetical protein [Alphaproteobacteria bacterium]